MENREKILECALDLFYHRGYDAVGIQEICTLAEVTKPTLYHYFGSKCGLLETLLEERLRDFIRELEQASAYADGVYHTLHTYATALLDFANNHRREYMLLMSMSYSARDNEVYQTVRPYITRIYSLTVQLFDQASRELGNMNGRQKEFAIGFLGLVNHYILFLGYQEEGGDRVIVSEEKKNSLIHQFMHGIYS